MTSGFGHCADDEIANFVGEVVEFGVGQPAQVGRGLDLFECHTVQDIRRSAGDAYEAPEWVEPAAVRCDELDSVFAMVRLDEGLDSVGLRSWPSDD